MSTLPQPAVAVATRPGRAAIAAWLVRVRPSMLLAPLALALAYLVLLIARYPQIVVWQNADSDVASWYLMGAAAGHAGTLQLSGQGIWPDLLLMYLTRSLSFHRVLWELIAPTISVVTVIVIVRSVASLGGRRAALLSAAILIAVSPPVLMSAISLGWHNLTPLGVAMLGGHLVWLRRASRRPAAIWGSVVGVALAAGMILACDELLVAIGLVPYLLAAALVTRDGSGARVLMVAIATTLITVAARIFTLAIGARLGIVMEAQPFGLTLHGVGSRAIWLFQGVLRIGNGMAPGPHAALETPLIVACGVVVICAIIAVMRLALRAHRTRRADATAAVHTSFWAIVIIGALLAYVVSPQVAEPSDRYLVIVLYATAATLPLTLARGGWVARGVQLGVVLVTAGSLVALDGGEVHELMYEGADVAHAGQIESVVAGHHLGVGYAGYWNASSLTWSTGGRLEVRPLAADHRIAVASFILRAADWYRPHAFTPSYLILAPADSDFPDRLPRTLPRPARVWHLTGGVTIDAWPYDIAAYLRTSPIPVPGLSTQALRHARRIDAAAG